MNYMIIQNTETPSTEVPPNVVQAFTNEHIQCLATFMQSVIDEAGDDMTTTGRVAADTFMQLLEQWEIKTQ